VAVLAAVPLAVVVVQFLAVLRAAL